MCQFTSVWTNHSGGMLYNHGKWVFPMLSAKCTFIFTIAFMTIGLVLIFKTDEKDKRACENPKSSNKLSDLVDYGSVRSSNIEQTLPNHPNDRKPMDAAWQIVNGTRFKFFVYSAFYDRRAEKIIRIVGATKTKGSDKVWCRFWYNENATHPNNGSVSVMARVKTIRENHGKYYSACYVICPVEVPAVNGLKVPYADNVVSELASPPGNVLLIRNTDDDADLDNTMNVVNVPDKIGACIAPFHSGYNSTMRLIEFIELNSLLGISHFTFYNDTLGPQVSCVMKYYMNDSLNRRDNQELTITLLQWDFSLLQMKFWEDIWIDAIYSALNDCAYRSMYRYKYAALIDVDEFLIPRQSNTLTEFLQQTQESIRKPGAYYFRNAFFCIEYQDDPTVSSHDNSSSSRVRAALHSQKKTTRKAKLNELGVRSKYLYIVEAGNHYVWEFMPGKLPFYVSGNLGSSNHYRLCEKLPRYDETEPRTEDRLAHKYSDLLVKRVESVYNQLKESCNLNELPYQ